MKKSLLLIFSIALLMAITIFTQPTYSQAPSCNNIIDLYFSYDSEGTTTSDDTSMNSVTPTPVLLGNGNDVFIVAKTSGCSDGDAVTFSVYETDNPGMDSPTAAVKTIVGTVVNNKAVARWKATYSLSDQPKDNVNLVKNPSFEVDTGYDYTTGDNYDNAAAGDNIPDGWKVEPWWWHGGLKTERSGFETEIPAAFGSKSAVVYSEDGTTADEFQGWLVQDIPVERGKTYTVRGAIQTNFVPSSIGFGGITTQCVYPNHNNYWDSGLGPCTGNIPLDPKYINGGLLNDWAEVEFQVTMNWPASIPAMYLRIVCLNQGDAGHAGRVWCDNVHMTESTNDGSVFDDIPSIGPDMRAEYIAKAGSAWSYNWIEVSRDNKCGDNLLTTWPGSQSSVAEACDVVGGIQKFFDGNAPRKPGIYDAGMRYCTAKSSSDGGCGILYSHVCGLESATVSPVSCPATGCTRNNQITITGTYLRETPPLQRNKGIIDCVPYSVTFAGTSTDGSCALGAPYDENLETVGYLWTAGSAKYDMPSSSNPLISIYPYFSQNAQLTRIPASCSGKTITSAAVYVHNSAGNIIGVAPVTTNIKFAPQCSDGIDNDGDGQIDYGADSGCTSETDNNEGGCIINDVYFSTTPSNAGKITTHAVKDGTQLYLVSESQDCMFSPPPAISDTNRQLVFEIYETDDGVTPVGAAITIFSKPWSSDIMASPAWTPRMDTTDVGDTAAVGIDETSEYIIKASNVERNVQKFSGNWIEPALWCDETPPNAGVQSCTSGKICDLVSGVPQLFENCNGQRDPANICACVGGACGQGDSNVFSQDFTAYSIPAGAVANFLGSTAIVGIDGVTGNAPPAIKLTKTNTNGYSVINFSTPIVSGKTYTVSADVKTSFSNFAKIVGTTGGVDPVSKVSESAYHAGDGTWQRLSYSFTAGTANHNILFYVGGSSGDAWIDNVKLTVRDDICIFNLCSLTSVEINDNKCGGTCGAGEKVTVTATYAGDNCPINPRVQVDAQSSDGLCTIAMTGADIQGINVPCSASPCTNDWIVPVIHPDCVGKVLNPVAASLRDSSNGFVASASSTPTGQFTFAGGPELTGVALTKNNFPFTKVKQGEVIKATGTLTGTIDGSVVLECGTTAGANDLCQSSPSATSPVSCDITAPWTVDGPQTVFCHAKYVSTGYKSRVFENTVTVDNTGTTVSIDYPASGTWLKSGTTIVRVSWGADAATCKYQINSAPVQTGNCLSDQVPISIGSSGSCYLEGSNTCRLMIEAYDDSGNKDSTSASYSVDFNAPVISSLANNPQFIGNNTDVSISVTASDSGSGVKTTKIFVNNIEAKSCPGSSCIYTTKFAPGTTVNYYATADDSVTPTPNSVREPASGTKSFTVCKIDSVVVQSCSDCKAGTTLPVTVKYSGACPINSYVNIDMASDDGKCVFNSASVQKGIQIACTASPCTADWTVPAISKACEGQIVKPKKAQLLAVGFPPQPQVNLFDELRSVSGVITFSYPQGTCVITDGTTTRTVASGQCDQLAVPNYCQNGTMRANATQCGCPADNFYTANKDGTCTLAACGATPFESCEVRGSYQTGLYCTGINTGRHIIANVSLMPGLEYSCTCPPGEQFTSKPYVVVYENGFETVQTIPIENAGGGIFKPGYDGSYSFLIDKTTVQGTARASLTINVIPGEDYTIDAWVSTIAPKFARLYSSSGVSSYHPGSGLWEQLSYRFKASSATHTIIMEAGDNVAGQVRFDNVRVRIHDYVCTGVCTDGTAVGECSVSQSYGMPYECKSSNPIPQANAQKCGCPAGLEPDRAGRFCVPPSCSDGTPYGSCSILNNTGTKNGVLFCDQGTLKEKPQQCGCKVGYAFDADTGTCVTCADAIAKTPPVGGYARCEQTGGSLSTLTHISNGTCSVSYDCTCAEGTFFDPASGCVDRCNNNDICEPYENKATCAADCPLEFTSVSTQLTDKGVRFSGSIGLSFATFRACDASATVEECISTPVDMGDAAGPMFCGDSFNKNCELRCWDKSDSFYLLADGPYIQGLSSKQATIASPIGDFTCPVLHVDQLENHLKNMLDIQDRAIRGLAQAIINRDYAATDEEKQAWERQINIFREILIITDPQIDLLRSVIADPDQAKVQDAFAKTKLVYDEILSILAGNVTTLLIGNVDYPSIVNLKALSTKMVEITPSIVSSGNSTRFGTVTCQVKSPVNNLTTMKSVCTTFDAGSTTPITFNFTVDKTGAWKITYCALDISPTEQCLKAINYHTKSDVGTINVTELIVLQITDVRIPAVEQKVGDRVVIDAKVKNIDEMDHKGFVTCTLTNPAEKRVTVSSINQTIPSGDFASFRLNVTVDMSGTWRILSCTAYRLGSIIKEGDFIVEDDFDVGPADFFLDPLTQSAAVDPGQTQDYELILKNTGVSDESYDLVTDTTNNWTDTIIVNKKEAGKATLKVGQSVNITVRVVAGQGNRSTTTLTVVSGAGRIKTAEMYTIINIPNRPPRIRVIESVKEVKQNQTITFGADLNDPDAGDNVSAKVCIGNCNRTCTLGREGSIYKCSITANMRIGTYTYFVNATDEKDNVASDTYSFKVVSELSCSSDNECMGGRTCQNGECKLVPVCDGTISSCYIIPGSETCGACGSGYACIGGSCEIRAECNKDTDCSSGKICQNMQCVEKTGSLTGCQKDSDCKTGEKCSASVCIKPEQADNNVLFIVMLTIVVIVIALILVTYIRKRWEESEEEEELF